jgi:hypothetical protein
MSPRLRALQSVVKTCAEFLIFFRVRHSKHSFFLNTPQTAEEKLLYVTGLPVVH